MVPPPFMKLRSLLAVFCAAILPALTGLAAPATIILHVPPGTPMPGDLAPLLSKWRQSGQVAGIVLLTQGRPEKPGESAQFEALALLEFPSDTSCDIWQKESGPALPAGVVARRADALIHGELTP